MHNHVKLDIELHNIPLQMQKNFSSHASNLAHKSLLSTFWDKKAVIAGRFEGFLWWPGWLKPLFATLSILGGGQIA